MKKKPNRRPALTAFYRLLIALVIGILIWILTGEWFIWQTRFLLSCLGYALTVLGFVWYIIGWADARQMAQREDNSRVAIFLFTIGAALISLFAVVVLLGSLNQVAPSEASRHVVLSGFTVVSAWTLIHSIFTMHYAHLYYYDAKDTRQVGGLDFPGKVPPDYLDFAYFSFVVGMTCQVSDVTVTSQRIRRLTLLHGVLSFLFNTLIIALSINTVSSLL
ncbi:DUF1345 domain-containing protein [Larkinella sp. C7]|uniref:DUF1345 domain-containing protein n=1 Tax=Larkinella sp. C7 TaxID=2576607 RepID=UPI0011110E27|nr:DUF1345 domain-containing protein [Larkinella sp. C7]